jgi:hypothetical protein
MPLTKATQNVIEGIVSTGSTGVSAGSFIVGQQYKITSLGTTTQAQWNTIAGTTGQTYVVGSLFTAATNGASSGNGAAAVARTLANRFADVVNVKDFGAVGDGVADDTAAIQVATNINKKIYFPSGIYKITSPINTSSFAVNIAGDGQEKSIILQTSVGNNCWNHGQITFPIYNATFEASEIAFKCVGAGGTALNITLDPTSGGFILRNVLISGYQNQTNNYWVNGIIGLGCSLTDFTNVTIIGRNGGSLNDVNNGITFGTFVRSDQVNPGAFVFNIRGGVVNYYKNGIVFNSSTYSGVEGATITEVNCNGCVNFVVHNNTIYPVNLYRAPQFVITNCQFEGFGSLFRFDGASYIWLNKNLAFINQPNGFQPTGFTAQDIIYIKNSFGITITENQLICYSGSAILYFIKFDSGGSGCINSKIRDNTFSTLGTSSGGIYSASSNERIQEGGTQLFVWPMSNPPFWTDLETSYKKNYSRTQIERYSDFSLVNNGGAVTCDEQGLITYNFSTTTTTDASGLATVTIPFGASIFKTIRNVIAVNGDSAATPSNIGSVSIVWSSVNVTNNTFNVKFVNITSITPVRINAIVLGY